MQAQWWHWIVFGIALVLAELAFPAMVLIWFGAGAVLLGLLLVLASGMSFTAQLATWTLVSAALTVLWFKIFKPSLHKTRVGRSSAEVVGEIGMLVQDVEPFRKGKVRFQKPMVGAEVWDCMADEAIRSGERVRVLSVEGSLLKVGKA